MIEGQRNGKFSQNGKLGHSCVRVMKSRVYDLRVRDHVVHLGLNVNTSAHNCGCVVNGGGAMAVFEYYYYIYSILENIIELIYIFLSYDQFNDRDLHLSTDRAYYTYRWRCAVISAPSPLEDFAMGECQISKKYA